MARKESALRWIPPLEEKARDKKVKAKSEILYDIGNSVTGMIVVDKDGRVRTMGE